jgi:hypothetical protein
MIVILQPQALLRYTKLKSEYTSQICGHCDISITCNFCPLCYPIVSIHKGKNMTSIGNDKMKSEYDAIKLRHMDELKEFRQKWKVSKHFAQRKMNGEKKMSSKDKYKAELIEKQEYKCVVCTDYLYSPALDHCHKKLQIREVLCYSCNTALGKFKDNTSILQNAIDYLNKHEEIYKTGNFKKYT